MNCEDIRELLPAYVLGALDSEEVAAVELHLREGREHDQELVELRATVFALDRFVGDSVPSGALAGRVAGLTASRPARPAFVRRPVAWPFRLPASAAVAAAIVLLMVFAAGWFSARTFSDSPRQDISFLLQGANGEVLGLTGRQGEQGVTVTMVGLSRLSGQSYQVWAIRDGHWRSIGVCNTSPQGSWVGVFPYTPQPGEAIALTVEPAGGSPAPTVEPLLQSRF
jgi:anti-sigma-K factor RskA